MRQQWSQLNKQQKGTFGEYVAKMEFAMYGFLVFTAEVDDRGIDFVVRNDSGQHYDVQVKTITGRNYTYVRQSKFNDNLVICLVVLEEGNEPTLYLLLGSDWKNDHGSLLRFNKYNKQVEPEYGIHASKENQLNLEYFMFENRVGTLCLKKL